MTTEVETENPEYSYTQRQEFTSEIFKIEVRNLGIFGIGEFKKLLRQQFELDASKVKTPSRRDFAYVCFRTQEDQEKALKVINGYVWKGRTLQALAAKAAADPLVKRRMECKNDDKDAKKPKNSTEATCPLAGIPYDDQLKQKQSEMEDILKSFGRQLVKTNRDAKKIIESNGLPCKFLGIKASPKIDGYRNKCEFSIGLNLEKEPIVGFRIGSYADGSLEVGPFDNLPHIPENMKKAAKAFEEYVKKSKYEVFNPEHNSGHFRQLGVRTSDTNDEVMISVGIYSQNLNENELFELKTEIKEFFENYDKTKFDCTSLYYQDLKRKEQGDMCNPVEHLLGKTHISDVIHGLKFRISPLAFFQVNTRAAEVLYQEAINLAKPKSDSIVLDICCGTGTIGLCFAKHCKQVVGVEIIPEAVKDAEFNAKENKIENCKFHVGNSDDYIQSMIKEASYSCLRKADLDLVAIVDPPRAGLHNRSILAIRKAQELNRLVYISCNPKSAQRNWIDLGRPESKSYRGSPFLPKIAIAVDMFPHTAHTEMVVLFERDI